MADYLQVDIATLSGDLSQITELIKSISADFLEVQEGLAQLNGSWSGEAHDAFAAQVDLDCASMEENLKNLDHFGSAIEKVKEEYSTCENEVSGQISQIRV